MQLTTQRRKDTGAFYTPYTWAKKAVEYMARTLPHPLHYYVFYDPAGGEGALLEQLPPECVSVASTLEAEDVEIMKSKGIHAVQFDFLDGDLADLPPMIKQAANMGRLVVFTNPPYFKLKADHRCFAKTEYGSNDSVMLFYYRIYKELMPQYLCAFNKLDILMPGDRMRQAVNEIIPTSLCLGGFLSHSKSWGLSGAFPIAFNMFELTDMCAYYGDIFISNRPNGYQWSLDIFDPNGRLLPYKKPSVRATILDDDVEFNEDGSCKDPELEARVRLCEAYAEKNYHRSAVGGKRFAIRSSQYAIGEPREAKGEKATKHPPNPLKRGSMRTANSEKRNAVQLAFDF